LHSIEMKSLKDGKKPQRTQRKMVIGYRSSVIGLFFAAKVFFALSIIIVSVTLSLGQSGYSRLPFASYLKMPVFADDEALGGVRPNFWMNPAMAANIAGGIEVRAGYRNRFGLIDDEFLGCAMTIGYFEAFGLLGLSTATDIEGRMFATAEPEYLFTANRANILVGGSAKYRGLSFGLGWRHIYEKIEFRAFDANTSSGGIAYNYRNLTVGMSVIDFGADQQYFDVIYPPPTVYRGQAWYVSKYVSFGVAAVKPDLNDIYAAVAIEGTPTDWVMLRGAYTINHDSRDFAFGTGFKWSGFDVNYSYSLYGDLGGNHTVSIGFVN